MLKVGFYFYLLKCLFTGLAQPESRQKANSANLWSLNERKCMLIQFNIKKSIFFVFDSKNFLNIILDKIFLQITKI